MDSAAGLTQVLSDGTNAYLYGNGRLAQYQSAMQYFGADALGNVRQTLRAMRAGRSSRMRGMTRLATLSARAEARRARIAYPDEYDRNAFYKSSTELKRPGEEDLRSPEELDKVFQIPPSSRSWGTMPDALLRLSNYYLIGEKDLFVHDIGFLYAGLPGRHEAYGNYVPAIPGSHGESPGFQPHW